MLKPRPHVKKADMPVGMIDECPRCEAELTWNGVRWLHPNNLRTCADKYETADAKPDKDKGGFAGGGF